MHFIQNNILFKFGMENWEIICRDNIENEFLCERVRVLLVYPYHVVFEGTDIFLLLYISFELQHLVVLPKTLGAADGNVKTLSGVEVRF